MSLRLQVNLIITALLAVFASLLIGLQIDSTRRSVREEIVGANVVATQLLSRMKWAYGSGGLEGMTGFLEQVGRIRANEVELYDAQGRLLYRSPPSSYKAGREAPQWYARIVSPPLQPKEISLPGGRIYQTQGWPGHLQPGSVHWLPLLHERLSFWCATL